MSAKISKIIQIFVGICFGLAHPTCNGPQILNPMKMRLLLPISYSSGNSAVDGLLI